MSFVAVIGVFTLTASSNGFWRHQQEQRLSLDDITVVDHSLLKRAVGAMALGNAMEWFDFGVYSYIAVTLGTFDRERKQIVEIGQIYAPSAGS